MATGRVIAGVAGRPAQTPFYRDPNIWTVIGVLLIQVSAAGIIWVVNPLYLLINMTSIAFPFAAYQQFITLPGVVVAVALWFFIGAVLVKTMGKPGKRIVRWGTLVFALGSAATVVSQAWQF